MTAAYYTPNIGGLPLDNRQKVFVWCIVWKENLQQLPSWKFQNSDTVNTGSPPTILTRQSLPPTAHGAVVTQGLDWWGDPTHVQILWSRAHRVPWRQRLASHRSVTFWHYTYPRTHTSQEAVAAATVAYGYSNEPITIKFFVDVCWFWTPFRWFWV